MKIFTNNLQLIFKLSNICLIILYLYPGSILGFFLYNDFSNQPQITRDFFQISSNHIYAFSLISILGLFAFKTKKKLFVYLVCLSIVLEIFHLVIPNRSFQTGDLNGNLLGVIISFLIYKVHEILFKTEKEYFKELNSLSYISIAPILFIASVSVKPTEHIGGDENTAVPILVKSILLSVFLSSFV